MTRDLNNAPAARQRDIFLGACQRADSTSRAGYLDLVCGDDLALRESVEELLREHESVGTFLEQPPLGAFRGGLPNIDPFQRSSFLSSAPVTERPGDWIGRYKLLEKIGEGGCGVVYMAEQAEPVRRRVALKVIKLGMDTESVTARFESERQALAMMDHPNIAKILDAGATEKGRPYFVMELIRGIRITEYCDQNSVPTRERLDFFIAVCEAIQHAHQKGIIHRDIKPSNILVTLLDGVAVVKVIDFGIAKAIEQRLTDKTLFTQFQAFLGTPAYTSPEQATMSGLDIDTRSDIYSLGVLLYELLTGQTPFDPNHLWQSGLDEMRRIIREEEPLPPSTRLSVLGITEVNALLKIRQTNLPSLVNVVRGDLDWIVMKCIEKDRSRRYATAHDLALDIRRYLDEEPVLARPPNKLYRFQKFVNRHRVPFAAGIAIAGTLIAGAGISIWLAVRAIAAETKALDSQKTETHSRQRAEREKAQARVNEYVADINLAQTSLKEGNFGRARQLVEKHIPKAGEPDLRGFEWRYLWKLCQGDEHAAFPSQEGNIHSLSLSPDGRLLAVGLPQKINILNIPTRSPITTINKGALSTAFFPDGRMLVTASQSTVRVWRTTDWSEVISLPETAGPIALSNDGERLATVSRNGVHIWDTSRWKELRVLNRASGPLAFSPDGKTLAAQTADGIALWPVIEDTPALVLRDSANAFGGRWSQNSRALVFSHDGKFIVGARNTPSRRGAFVLSIWDPNSGREIGVLPGDSDRAEHTGVISSLAFSPDGSFLATTSWDHSIHLWDFTLRRQIATLHGHRTEVWASVFTPDGKSIMTGAKDGSLNLWPVQHQSDGEIIPGNWRPLAFAKDNHTLAALSSDETVVFLNTSTGEGEHEREIHLDRQRFGQPPLAFSDDLNVMVEGRTDGKLKIWNHDDITTLKAFDSPVEFVSLSPGGAVVLAASRDRPLHLWDLHRGTDSAIPIEGQRFEISPDGQLIAAFQRGNDVAVFDVAKRSLRSKIVTTVPAGFVSVFSPDGHILATTTGPNEVDSGIWLWDTANGKLIGTCLGHKQPIFSLAFSPDGKTLASSSDDSTLKLWNVTTQQELLSIQRLGARVVRLMFSPDGQLLAAGENSSTPTSGLRLYRAPR